MEKTILCSQVLFVEMTDTKNEENQPKSFYASKNTWNS